MTCLLRRTSSQDDDDAPLLANHPREPGAVARKVRMRKYCTPVRALPPPELVHVQHPRERRPVAMLKVDGAAVRREFCGVRDDERAPSTLPRYMEPLSHHLEELLHEGRDGRRGVDFLHRWRESRLVFNRCCLEGLPPLALCAASDGRASPHRSRTGPVRF